ncbi:bacterioferritin [Sphingomicrobium sediminis]|uniref:Bacterioferritin n=1 Tax=Sphingomicrobium sediminis TaxID=2950949 RepID=A0A9X2ELA0_9SPHN|nr:bacterioferritin [Sphingomicrobium sediminis]MCM8557584.1 bacterioferritin [Sphingomicrobium sediminis]
MAKIADKKMIEYLNQALTNELTAVNQYWLHYRILDNLGVTRLAAFERKESIEEMEHADRITERILFLDGHPNYQRLAGVRTGENVEEIIQADLDLEMDAIPLLRDAVEYAESIRDYVTRELLADILVNEEEHLDYLETQQDLIKQMGLQNYVQLQSKPADDSDG